MAKAPCMSCENRCPCCYEECDRFQEYKSRQEKFGKMKNDYRYVMYNIDNPKYQAKERRKNRRRREEDCYE